VLDSQTPVSTYRVQLFVNDEYHRKAFELLDLLQSITAYVQRALTAKET